MSKMRPPVVIGTRGSDLALWQANTVADLLEAPCEIRIVKTSGDRFLDTALQGKLEKGFFTKEIEEKLLSGGIDLAVHSLKDLPTEVHPELHIGAHLERAVVSDLLLVHPDWQNNGELLPLRTGCKVGATSLRRQALLKLFAPGTEAVLLRGNVPTRIDKCREGEYGAIILAWAGVDRLKPELDPLLVYELDPWTWLPAPGQGAIAVQVRANDSHTRSIVAGIDDKKTAAAVTVERRLLANFEGGCHTAFGAWARFKNGQWMVKVGFEHPGEGWVQTSFTSSLETCLEQGPRTLTGFSVPDTIATESLCRRIL